MNNNEKVLTKAILEHPHEFSWTLQGFGMLRTYLESELRLHVWDSRYRVPNVSMMHDHPWDFYSEIIAGRVVQYRFVYSDGGRSYLRQTIKCGEGGGLCGGPEEVNLAKCMKEVYNERESYEQLASEIHVSLPYDGTVTLIRRTFKEDTEHAHVFWDTDKEWVTAEPRPATPKEINSITAYALAAWF